MAIGLAIIQSTCLEGTPRPSNGAVQVRVMVHGLLDVSCSDIERDRLDSFG